MDGNIPVKSCTMFAVMADGHAIKTVEGMIEGGVLHPLQQAFWDQHGLQCGYCTPGMMLTAAAMLDRNPNPSEHEIREFLSGNLCRCTGYQNIITAVQQAARVMAEQREPVVGPAAAG
jgi:carbon-monoxide dehydrogenase small subunit